MRYLDRMVYTRTVAAITPLDQGAMDAARARQAQLTKPRGSLGRLEDLAIQVAGITGRECPRVTQKVVLTCAGDHGVAAEGVSAYPQEVTRQMVANILAGGAAVSVLARQAGARLKVVDAGVAAELPPHPDLYSCKVAPGTRNLARGPAMTRDEAMRTIEVGIAAFEAEYAQGLDLVATGEMGIANTTPATAIVAALTGLPVPQLAGRGTGIDDAGLERKIAAIERGLAVNRPNPADALDVLSKVGGYEIGAIAGIVLAAAAHRVPVVVDGYISTSGAMIAAGLCPAAAHYVIASHRSVEIGHQAMWDYLGIRPLLDLNLRLGEGTGAVLAMHLVDAACRILGEMATFASAGVSGRE
jgi:nicotinate-nucleotide--dimethylbenzimidazole phosphoribosyltransferase